jgi:hypothetical protein
MAIVGAPGAVRVGPIPRRRTFRNCVHTLQHSGDSRDVKAPQITVYCGLSVASWTLGMQDAYNSDLVAAETADQKKRHKQSGSELIS